tara:strand:- start:941 stop:1912 length:972 start_codon:yes stop_codon:yes gene_type:complete
MYNIIVKKYGKPEVLSYEKDTEKKILKNCVKILVASAGINFADILTIQGRYQERPRPPFSPGLEVSGIIQKVGKDVTGFKAGEKVMAIMKYGGYQQNVIVPAENTYKVPKNMPLIVAGGFPVIYGTAYSALVTKASIQKGETCLILGATGGVGIAAVEIAHAYGAKVIACGGDDKKLDICKNKGALHLINYKKNIIRTQLLKKNIKEVDVVIDMIGGQATLDAVKSLSWNGRLVIVGFASGKIPDIPANRLLLKNAKAEGLYWGELAYRCPKKIKDDFRSLELLYKNKKINPSIYKVFKLSEATQALNYLTNRKNVGKIVLKC